MLELVRRRRAAKTSSKREPDEVEASLTEAERTQLVRALREQRGDEVEVSGREARNEGSKDAKRGLHAAELPDQELSQSVRNARSRILPRARLRQLGLCLPEATWHGTVKPTTLFSVSSSSTVTRVHPCQGILLSRSPAREKEAGGAGELFVIWAVRVGTSGKRSAVYYDCEGFSRAELAQLRELWLLLYEHECEVGNDEGAVRWCAHACRGGGGWPLWSIYCNRK